MDILLSNYNISEDIYPNNLICELLGYYKNDIDDKLLFIINKYFSIFSEHTLNKVSKIQDIRIIFIIKDNWNYFININIQDNSYKNPYENLFQTPYLYEIDEDVMNDRYQQLDDINNY
jgi:hypothetical protein